MTDLDRLARLEFDIDLRIANLWEQIDEVAEWTPEIIASFIRTAYGRGYVDALKEDTEGERAKLCIDNGYKAL